MWTFYRYLEFDWCLCQYILLYSDIGNDFVFQHWFNIWERDRGGQSLQRSIKGCLMQKREYRKNTLKSVGWESDRRASYVGRRQSAWCSLGAQFEEWIHDGQRACGKPWKEGWAVSIKRTENFNTNRKKGEVMLAVQCAVVGVFHVVGQLQLFSGPLPAINRSESNVSPPLMSQAMMISVWLLHLANRHQDL